MSSSWPSRDPQPASSVSPAIMSRYQTLRRLLVKTSYTSPFQPALFLTAAPPSLTLPILSHAVLSYSPALTGWFLGAGLLVSSSALTLSSLWSLLHAVFGYHPMLSQQQFGSERGYVERKLQLLADVLQLCVAKAEELERDKGGGSGSAGKGGVPRVAVLVKEKRRSAGEEREERKEVRQPQPSAGSTLRQQKREERKVEQFNDEEDEEQDDSGSPERQQHQHVSFTHEDSSQPLSPSHLSPLSSSTRSPHRASPARHSHSHSHPSPSSSSSTSSKAAMDPLLALHQQLHRISHRTSQLSHNQPHHTSPPNDPSAQPNTIDRLTERVQALEATVRDELAGLRREVADMRQRLEAAELSGSQREPQRQQTTAATKAGQVEETKEAAGGSGDGEERVTRDGGGGSGSESGGATSSVLPSDMSEFLTHMNDRLSSTAKLLESSRRARGRPSEGE